MAEIKESYFEPGLVPKEKLPLYEKRILFTTPRNYASTLGKLLLERGARIVWMPTVEIWPISDYRELDQTIRNLNDYDWVAFTSENGIEPFCSRLKAMGLNHTHIQNTRLAAFKKDSLILERNGLKADLIPEQMSPGGIIDELVKRGVRSGRVLVPCPEVVGVKEPYVVPEFISELKKIGMTVRRLEVYRTVALKDSGLIEKDMLINHRIDIIIFTSSAEIFSLLEQIGDKRDVLNNATIAYMGKFTARTGRELGLHLDIVPEQYSMPDLVKAIEAYF